MSKKYSDEQLRAISRWTLSGNLAIAETMVQYHLDNTVITEYEKKQLCEILASIKMIQLQWKESTREIQREERGWTR